MTLPDRSAAPDVVVVGGGVIGCACAYHLTRAGARVVVLERAAVGSEASGGAAGMLAPQLEAHERGAFLDLALHSRSLFPDLAASLHAESGVDVELDMEPMVRVAADEAEAAELHAMGAWQRSAGLQATWLDRAELAAVLPGARGVGALQVPGGQVSSPRLVEALAEAAALRGAQVREGVPVLSLVVRGDRVAAVRTPEGDLAAGAVVLAAGPWSTALAAPAGVSCAVRPVRGQIVRLRALPRTCRVVAFAAGCYLVPKQPDEVWVGATMEEAGFDRRVTAGAVAGLLQAACQLLPALGDASVASTWAGLRPASADGLPLLGPAPGVDGLFVAAGHFRNGILLSAATGPLVADLVMGRADPASWRPFDPARAGIAAATATRGADAEGGAGTRAGTGARRDTATGAGAPAAVDRP